MDVSVSFIIGYLLSIINLSIVIYSMTRQIRLNAALKSASGLSLTSLLVQLSSRLAHLYFSIALAIPAIYPFSHGALLFFQLIMTWQYFVYSHEKRSYLHTRALIVFGLSLFMWGWLYTAKHYYVSLGNIVGWIIVFSQIVTDGPQLIHNWQRRSVKGFSYQAVWLNVIAIFMGTACNYLFSLPLQAHFQSWFSLFVKLVLLIQCRYYRQDTSLPGA